MLGLRKQLRPEVAGRAEVPCGVPLILSSARALSLLLALLTASLVLSSPRWSPLEAGEVGAPRQASSPSPPGVR